MANQQIKKQTVRSFRDLIVWQKAMLLAECVYDGTRDFPRADIYGLTSQMRRAAISVASNIAEGQARQSRGEMLQFIGHARGSLAELETQTLLSTRLGLLEPEKAQRLSELCDEVGRLLTGLRTSLHKPNSASSSLTTDH